MLSEIYNLLIKLNPSTSFFWEFTVYVDCVGNLQALLLPYRNLEGL